MEVTIIETSKIVERKLGVSTRRLYEDVESVRSLAAFPQTRNALRVLILNLLCGAYHDYRSDAPMPKGDLVEALRAVPTSGLDPARAARINEIIAAVLRGEYDEDDKEAKRWEEQMTRRLRETIAAKPPQPPRAIELSEKQRLVFCWLSDYVGRCGRPPTLMELASGTGLTVTNSNSVLEQLRVIGAVSHLGGSRGWMPNRTL